jgi:hypothetical protein
MKRLIIILFVALTTISVSAQNFGMKAGVNLAGYTGSDATDFTVKMGCTIGGLYQLPLTDKFFLQPEVLLTLKGSAYSSATTYAGKTYIEDTTFNPFYIEVPVKGLYKIEAGSGNITLAAGPYVAMGIAGKASRKDAYNGTTEKVSYNLFSKEDGEDEAYLKRFDGGLTCSVGYEFENGLFMNLDASYGLLNISTDSNVKNFTVGFSTGIKF